MIIFTPFAGMQMGAAMGPFELAAPVNFGENPSPPPVTGKDGGSYLGLRIGIRRV